jgi:dolichol-phosphate mannosyltransferase
MSDFFMIRHRVFFGSVRQLSGVGFKILLDVIASSPQPLQLKELPYTFRSRQFGESKLDGQAGWEYLLMLLDKWLGQLIPIRFLSFALVGGLGMVVHLLTLTFLFEGMKVSFLNSQIVATFVAMTSNFTLNNVLTYRDVRLRGWHWLQGWVSFTFACSIGAFANVSIASHLFEKGTMWIIAALVGITVSAVWNYAMTRAYTWKKPQAV